jgi:hypothetical protein
MIKFSIDLPFDEASFKDEKTIFYSEGVKPVATYIRNLDWAVWRVYFETPFPDTNYLIFISITNSLGNYLYVDPGTIMKHTDYIEFANLLGSSALLLSVFIP